MKRLGNLLTLTYLLLITIFGFNCSSKKQKQASENAQRLTISGSSTVYPITNNIIDKYRVDNTDLNIQIDVSGTGGGFAKFATSQIMINNASRPIKESETKACKDAGIEYTSFEIAYDGIAVVVNNDNSWVDYLTVDELKRIWSEDGVTKWNELRGEWPNKPIKLYGPGSNSGTYDYFSEAILGKENKIKEEFIKSENDNLLVKGISHNETSLGFFGLAYYQEYKGDLKLVPISNNQNKALYPTEETISSGTYKPLSRPLFIYVNNELIKTEKGKKFLKFYLNNALEATKEVGYVPLPEAKYKELIKGI